MRVYFDSSVPADAIQRLVDEGAEVVNVTG